MEPAPVPVLDIWLVHVAPVLCVLASAWAGLFFGRLVRF